MASTASRTIAVLVALALTLAACGGDDGDGDGSAQQQETTAEGPETITVDGETANFRGRADVSGQGSAEVGQSSFSFAPTVLEGESGQSLTVRLDNTSGTAHSFTIRDQNVDAVVDGGDSAEAEVSFPESGTIVFVCRFHEQQGMRGALQVADGGDSAQDTPPDGQPETGDPDQAGGSGGGGGPYD